MLRTSATTTRLNPDAICVWIIFFYQPFLTKNGTYPKQAQPQFTGPGLCGYDGSEGNSAGRLGKGGEGCRPLLQSENLGIPISGLIHTL